MSVINKIQIGKNKDDLYDIGVDWSNVTNPPNYAGSSTVGGPANSVALSNGTADASRFIIFQDGANRTSVLTPCYDTDFKYNPVSNLMNVGSVQLNSKVTLQYNSSTESLDFIFA